MFFLSSGFFFADLLSLFDNLGLYYIKSIEGRVKFMAKKIIIIDDEPQFCELLVNLIQENGEFECHTFTCSEDALHKLKNIRPDLVFVDMLMPKMDGGAVIKFIKESLSPSPLVVMVTGMIAEDETSNVNFPILAKPINYNSLKNILAKI